MWVLAIVSSVLSMLSNKMGNLMYKIGLGIRACYIYPDNDPAKFTWLLSPLPIMLTLNYLVLK